MLVMCEYRLLAVNEEVQLLGAGADKSGLLVRNRVRVSCRLAMSKHVPAVLARQRPHPPWNLKPLDPHEKYVSLPVERQRNLLSHRCCDPSPANHPSDPEARIGKGRRRGHHPRWVMPSLDRVTHPALLSDGHIPRCGS